MPRDEQARVIRAQLNNLIRLCADIAEREGPAAVRALVIEESAEVPNRPPQTISPAYAAALAKQAAARQCDCEAQG